VFLHVECFSHSIFDASLCSIVGLLTLTNDYKGVDVHVGNTVALYVDY
jgi:hypothetical protein